MSKSGKFRKNAHPVYFLTDEEIIESVNKSSSYREILRGLGIEDRTHARNLLKKRILNLGIDTSDLKRRHALNRSKTLEYHNPYRIMGKQPIEKYLVKGIKRNNQMIKKKLIEENLKKDICEICGLNNSWNNKPITLQLDHIDGDNLNNELENLRILCPNCHSQTPTWTGRNVNNTGMRTRHCKLCKIGISVYSSSGFCFDCWQKETKNGRPDYKPVVLQTEWLIYYNNIFCGPFESKDKLISSLDLNITRARKRKGVATKIKTGIYSVKKNKKIFILGRKRNFEEEGYKVP